MEPKVNYALVGLFVVLFGSALIGAGLWLATGSLRQSYDTYYIFINESVSGLNTDAPVKYRGVAVGRVARIELAPGNPGQVRLTAEIRRGTPIKENTVATLRLQGLTGIAYVELSGGTAGAAPLKIGPGQRYPVIRSKPSFLARLDSDFPELLTNVTQLSKQLTLLLNGRNRAAISGTLQHMEAITGDLARQTDTVNRVLAGASTTLRNTARATAGLDRTLRRIGDSAAALQRMADRIALTTDALTHTLKASSPGVERFSGTTLPQVQGLVTDLHRLVDNLTRISGELRDDPRILLFGRRPRAPGPGE
jgi:phospholipid/cholesterol/gamma-HCH transport system substrate-binding protein